jgi:ribonuclease BN (tRNA processing enzyme)
MELTFIGKGSAFNPQLGNNSAYIKAGSSLFLLDCGGTVFSKLLEKDVNGSFILDGVDTVIIAITHLHPDHIGSLGDLIYYCNYVIKNPARIIYPNSVDLQQLLYKMGVRSNMYHFIDTKVGQTIGYKFNEMEFFIEPVEVVHFMGLLSYAFLLQTNDKTIYYSGDSKEIPQDILKMLTDGKIDEFYHDISGHPVDVREYWPHLQYEDAVKLLPLSVRDKIYFMHMDEEFNQIQAIADGFKVV